MLNIKFKNSKNEFQEKMKEDINEIKTSDKMLVAADKSRHIYKMEKQQYNGIQNSWQKTSQKLIKNLIKRN